VRTATNLELLFADPGVGPPFTSVLYGYVLSALDVQEAVNFGLAS